MVLEPLELAPCTNLITSKKSDVRFTRSSVCCIKEVESTLGSTTVNMVVEYASVTTASFALVSIVTLAVIVSHFRRRFPKDIQGPPSPSFLFGTPMVFLDRTCLSLP